MRPTHGWVCMLLMLFLPPHAASGEFLRAEGARIVNKLGDTVMLRGGAITQPPDSDPLFDPEDIRRIAELGGNCARLDLDYRWFYGETNVKGFEYIDSVIDAAGKKKIRVVLSMYRRPGMETDVSDAPLWNDQENQDMLVELWAKIAEEYQDRPEIAAYHLMRDPEPPDAYDYGFFMQYLVDSVREADLNHMLIIEEPRAGAGLFEFGASTPLLYGPSLAYGFREYHPEPFTLQGTGGRPQGIGWPGEYLKEVREVTSAGKRSTQGTHEPRQIKLEAIAPEGADFVSPSVYIDGQGRARFERIFLTEVAVFGPQSEDKTALSDTFSEFGDMWWEDPIGARMSWERGTASGEGSLVLEGQYGAVSAQPYNPFDVHRLPKTSANRRYRLSAQVGVENAVEAGLSIVFLGAKKIYSDSADIELRLKDLSDWSRRSRVPLILLDFAAPRHAPENSGLEWLNAILDGCRENGFSWLYSAWDETKSWADLRVFLTNSLKFRSIFNKSSDLIPAKKFSSDGLPQNPENPVPPPKNGAWFGAYAGESADPLRSATTFAGIMSFTRRITKMPAWIHVFHYWKNDAEQWVEFPHEEFQEIHAAGVIPLLSWENSGIPNSIILEGHADTYIQSWADAARRLTYPFVIRLSPQSDSAMYRHVRDLFDHRGARNVSWMWAPAIFEESAWPGDTYVDWIGFSLYDTENSRLFPVEKVAAFLEITAPFKKPICIAEAGRENGPEQAKWWVHGLRELREPHISMIRAVVLMEAIPHDGTDTRDFRLRNDAVYYAGRELSNAYFVGGE